MPVARPESSDARVIAHVDMDCFYVQVEQRRRPELRGQPAAVVQYNSWKGGGLIAVGYEARKFGVKRSMRGDDAKKVCPNIHLVQVPVARGKADLTIYRDAGSEVVTILSRKGRCERASIDEVYLDLTDAAEAMLADSPPESVEQLNEEVLKSHILGLNEDEAEDAKERVREWLCDNNGVHRDKLLACGAIIVSELRRQVLDETQFTCSAGVAHNKMLAKLASGMNKPAQQTVVPHSAVKDLLDPLPIKKMKQLGGKLGDSLQMDLGVKTVGDLLQFSEGKLQEHYGANTGTWLWNIARGISGDEVQGRLLPKSHGSGKTFPGRQSLKTLSSVHRWLNDLCEDLSERLQADLDKNKRIARTLTLHANAYKSSEPDSLKKFPSKSCTLRYGTTKIQEDAFSLFQAALREYLGACHSNSQVNQESEWGITGLSVSASKIECIPAGTCTIRKYFQGQDLNYTSAFDANGYNEGMDSDRGCVKGSKEDMTVEERETWTVSALCSLDSQGQNKQSQGTSTIRRYFQDKEPNCFLDKKAASCFETAASLAQSGRDFNPSSNVEEMRSGVPLDETSTMSAQYDRSRHEQKRKSQGSSSIASFFQHSGSSQQHGNEKNTYDSKELERSEMHNGLHSCSGVVKEQEPERRRRALWNYKVEEIDPAVMNELPPELQDELRMWLQPQKRKLSSSVAPKSGGVRASKQSGNIAKYFLPSKKD